MFSGPGAYAARTGVDHGLWCPPLGGGISSTPGWPGGMQPWLSCIWPLARYAGSSPPPEDRATPRTGRLGALCALAGRGIMLPRHGRLFLGSGLGLCLGLGLARRVLLMRQDPRTDGIVPGREDGAAERHPLLHVREVRVRERPVLTDHDEATRTGPPHPGRDLARLDRAGLQLAGRELRLGVAGPDHHRAPAVAVEPDPDGVPDHPGIGLGPRDRPA